MHSNPIIGYLMQSGDIIKKLSNWYFSKRVLPYWVIMLADAAIVFGCGVLTYWVSSNSQITYEHHQAVFISALIYAVISFIGARIFRTYSGVLRYSSFVDLLKLTYANTLSLVIALAITIIGRPSRPWSALSWPPLVCGLCVSWSRYCST